MSYRPYNNELRDSLYNNDPYIIAHLIKFERPTISSTYSGISAEKATDYSYLTDSIIDIDFDDGSFNRQQQYVIEKDALANTTPTTAVPNGSQTYHANKILTVGTINEGIEAKASSLNLQLDATALGSAVMSTCTFNADQNTITTDIDLSEEGFSEGDKILFSAGAGANNGKSAVINRFTAGGTVLKVTQTGGSAIQAETNKLYQITLLSEEISTLILGNGNVSYTNYINREVIIYRVHINPETNEIIGGRPGFTGAGSTYTSGGAMLLFKGIISNASLKEDPKKGATMSWTLSSHWGDFVRVQNRVTQDSDHRALNTEGQPDLNMILRKEYAGDMGFAHSELALNLIATYNKTETRQKTVYKKKNLGLSKKVSFVDYDVEVPTDIDLKLNLQAKALPVVYGVQKIDSIPFFFDNLKASPNQVYAGYALCEGPIGGVLDILLDDKTTICVDKNDETLRSAQTEEESVDIVCQGRQDRGQTLVGTPASTGVGIYTHTAFTKFTYNSLGSIRRMVLNDHAATYNAEPIQGSHYYTQETRVMEAGGVGYKGIQHEEAFRFTKPIDCTLVFHKGTGSQAANHLLVEKASNNLFKIQNDFYKGNPGTYWTPNHRVLDTAYCIGEFVISEGETTMPSLDFIVRGRDVECHNYDDSYAHNSSYASENPANFDAYDTVYISGDGITEYETIIIDKWSFLDGNGDTQHRFRWEVAPTPTKSALKMSTASGSGGTEWHMQVGNATLATGSISTKLEAPLHATQGTKGSIILASTPAAWNLAMAATSASDTFEGTPSSPAPRRSAKLGFYKSGVSKDSIMRSSSIGFETYNAGASTIGELPLLDDDSSNGDVVDVALLDTVILRNAIKLPNALNGGTAAEYVGATITLYRYDATSLIPYVQERNIFAWNVASSNVVAIVDEPWDAYYEPQSGDLFSIKTKKDTRVSINPAMQLMDYIKNKRYGKGLKDSDIDLATFKDAAQKCDTRSEITVIAALESGTTPVPGAKYAREHSGITHFYGTVSKVVPVTVGGVAHLAVTFKDCVGKIAQKWNDYNTFGIGQVVWSADVDGVKLKRKTGSTGTMASITTGSVTIAALQLSKVSGTGGTLALNVSTSLTSGDGNPVVKDIDTAGGISASGYSLYDSDNVKYWKYLGWDSHAQRNVTRHQLNHTINTQNTVFDNINNMLRQFNGILRYSNGKYQLNVKSQSAALSQYEKVDETDIIGQIKITDKGSKKTFNSVSANIIDPQNNFEPRAVSFFNSEYLRQDNGVPKKGNFATPAITNYFNARFNIKQFLDESRNGLEIQLTVRPSGMLLQAGEVIGLSYPRFGWDEKLWRITNLNFLSNGNVSITAEEHADTAYVVEASEVGGRGGEEGGPGIVVSSLTNSPNSLIAIGGGGGIRLTWKHGVGYNAATHDVQVFSNVKNVRTMTTTATGGGTNSISLTIPAGSAQNNNERTDLGIGTVIRGKTTSIPVVSGNSYAAGIYIITTVGTTNWNNLNGTSGTNYQIGDVVNVASGTLSGTGAMKGYDQPVKVTAVNTQTGVVILSAPLTWASGDSFTFTAPLIAGNLDTDTYTDPVTETALTTTRYYWVRYSIKKTIKNVAGQVNKKTFSAFHPTTTEGVEGIGLSADVLRDLTLSTSLGTDFVYTNGGGSLQASYPANTTITAAGVNVLGTANYKFEKITKDGTVSTVQAFSSDTTFVYTPPTGSNTNDNAAGFDLLPQRIRVTFKDTYNGVDYLSVKELTMRATRILLDGNNGNAGANGYTIAATNQAMILSADSTGAVPAIEQFISNITVNQGSTGLSYSTATSNWADNTWHFGTISEITGAAFFAVSVANSGTLTLASNSSIYSNPAHLAIVFDAQIKDKDNAVIGTLRYQIDKRLGIRLIGNLELEIDATEATITLSGKEPFTEYQFTTITTNSSSFATGNARDWMGGGLTQSFATTGHTELAPETATAAIKIAASLVDDEGQNGEKILRTGDRFRIRVMGAANETFMAGERIYIGAPITSTAAGNLGPSARDHTSWSTLVAERVMGSMIVDGTLSADSIDSNSVRTTVLNATSSIILGSTGNSDTSSTRGKIYSAGKTAYGASGAGFFLGFEGTSSSVAKFHIGTNNDFLKWSGTALEIQSRSGGFSLKSATSSSRLEIVNDVIEIYSGSESTPRVKIGNLA